jgi:hypothetical protein
MSSPAVAQPEGGPFEDLRPTDESNNLEMSVPNRHRTPVEGRPATQPPINRQRSTFDAALQHLVELHFGGPPQADHLTMW